MFLGKKGTSEQELWKQMFEIFLFAAFILAAFLIVNNKLSDDAFFLTYYALDTGMIVDSLHGAPGDVKMSYAVKEEMKGKIDFIFKKSWVETKSSEVEGNLTKKRFPYANSSEIEAFHQEKIMEQATSFNYIKEENKIDVK